MLEELVMDLVDLTGNDDAASRQAKRRRVGGQGSGSVEVVSLLDDDDTGERSARAAPGASASTGRARRAPADQPPPWAGMRGTKRIVREFTALAHAIERGAAPVSELTLRDEDDVSKWRFKMRDFDDDVPGGRQLNADLAQLSRTHGQDHILMEITFPKDYPTSPFSIRVVSPRMVWYTGHVTAGGSICIEALTQTGSPNAWQPEYSVAGLLTLVKNNMLHVEAVQVRTATGPGGLAGPLRVDLNRRYTHNVMQPYSEGEAQAAFARMVSHHRQNGW